MTRYLPRFWHLSSSSVLEARETEAAASTGRWLFFTFIEKTIRSKIPNANAIESGARWRATDYFW